MQTQAVKAACVCMHRCEPTTERQLFAVSFAGAWIANYFEFEEPLRS